MKFAIVKGTTSKILNVFIQDSSSTTGAGLGSLDQTSGIVGGYIREGATGVALAVDENVTTEGTYQAPSAAGKVRIGTPANQRTGVYELHVHNDLLAVGADSVFISLGGGTDMADLIIEIQLTEDRLLLQQTTIASLTSQTQFILAAGSADAEAYVNCTIVIEDSATAVQKCVGLISAYAVTTREVTLLYDPGIFTIATGDKVYILAENSLKSDVQNRQLKVSATGGAAPDWAAVKNPASAVVLSNTTIGTTTANTDMRGTDGVAALLPAALVGGRMDANASAIDNNAAAAVRLALSASGMPPGTVDNTAHVPTTTEFEADDITKANPDALNGRNILWTSGALIDEMTDITDYVLTGGRGHFTVTAMTAAPANNDTFIIV